MKQGWQIKKLGEVCEMYQPKTISTKEMVENGAHPVFGANGIIGKYDKYNHEEPQLLITCRGATCGSVNISEPKSWINGNAMVVRSKDNSIDFRFLEYLFRGGIDLSKVITGAAQPQITRQALIPIEISYPKSLEEQQRIVSILDRAFSAIDKAKANAEQNLRNAKELFESYLQGVFESGNENWEVNCLDELGTITSSKRIYKSEYVKEGVPFYRTKEIKELSNGKPITLELFISRQRYEEIKQSFGVPKIGDLLMSAVGTIGEIMVIENEDEFYFKDGNIVWFKNFDSLDTNYLKYALTAFVEKIKSLAIGAAYSALTIEKLNKYQISFPKSKTEQQTIVRQLDALRAETQKLEAVYQKKLEDLEELKKSILQKAFAGELKTEKALAV
ncbi:MAG TPA: restriction endonuclease subunit S [Tenuifilaceae bacterium]|jgi:type I restriction enzyme S subunit|nr:restriction endonuclease subunit S [Bacteroidales bacterium]MDI9516354.1 restriction endonuclease subunit S [Bacteroidota bacterium]NLH56831.1 restriction endonuclease subunit S [Rikenellaceae bacterium]HNV81420.1 restriction endonuclease subunit S [Tenuifilaceae bacterium]MZP82249.1 restriction endonuclease subunit S [Bacteroidales bacterium]